MNKIVTSQNAQQSDISLNEWDLSPAAKQLLSIGEDHYWNFRVLGKAPMLHEHVRVGDWMLVPAQEDTSPIPGRAMERIQTIFAAGIRPQGFVLVHEAPMLLTASTMKKEKQQANMNSAAPNLLMTENIDAMIKTIVPVAEAVCKLAVSLLTAGATVALPAAAFMFSALLLDPILVAVTEDGYWIEIDRWWNEE
jgi:hypothetical protein